MKLVRLCVFLCVTLLVTACGGDGGSSSTTTTDPTVDPVDTAADNIELSTSLESGTVLSQGGETTFTASVTYTTDDGEDINVPDGEKVLFSIEEGGGQITSSATTTSGKTQAVYSAGTYGGSVTVKATLSGGELSDSLSFEVASGDPASIRKISAEPDTIGVKGSGTDTSVLTFEVRDAAGNIVSDGKLVEFNVVVTPSGGVSLSKTEANTSDGKVSVAVQSGTTSGPVDVSASYYDANSGQIISTVAKITIVSGAPDAKRMSMSTQYKSLDATINGLESQITATIVDRYGNPVADGTPVSFMTEDGTIGSSEGFETTTTSGQATVTFRTAHSDNQVGSLCTIVAYTSGSESYADENGNGVYDDGEEITKDLSDPYIDADDSGTWSTGELYVDADENESFTDIDGTFDQETTIWKNMKILFSDGIGQINLSPASFTVNAGESVDFTFDFKDENGNALLAGSTYVIETSVGEIAGATEEFTQADTNGVGAEFSFTLNIASDEEAGPVQVSITVTLPDGAQGGRGLTLTDFATGTINAVE